MSEFDGEQRELLGAQLGVWYGQLLGPETRSTPWVNTWKFMVTWT